MESIHPFPGEHHGRLVDVVGRLPLLRGRPPLAHFPPLRISSSRSAVDASETVTLVPMLSVPPVSRRRAVSAERHSSTVSSGTTMPSVLSNQSATIRRWQKL